MWATMLERYVALRDETTATGEGSRRPSVAPSHRAAASEATACCDGTSDLVHAAAPATDGKAAASDCISLVTQNGECKAPDGIFE